MLASRTSSHSSSKRRHKTTHPEPADDKPHRTGTRRKQLSRSNSYTHSQPTNPPSTGTSARSVKTGHKQAAKNTRDTLEPQAKPMPAPGTPQRGSREAGPAKVKPAASKAISIPSPARNHISSHGQRMPEKQQARYTGSRHSHATHESKPIRPQVAAMLAMTAIPGKKSFHPRRQPRVVEKELTVEELMQEWRKEEFDDGSLSGPNSAMDILLSPPDEDTGSAFLSMSDSLPSFSYRSRSQSNDSVPSLVTDDSSVRNMSRTSSDESGSFKTLQRRRTSSLVSPESAHSHPLEASIEDDEENETPASGYSSPASSTISTPASDKLDVVKQKGRPAARKTTFASGLTARLMALRNGRTQQSSRLPPPEAKPFALPWSCEIYPKLDGPPSAEVRRYLNPPTGPPTTTTPQRDFYMHTRLTDAPLDRDTRSEADLRALEASRNEGCALRADDLLALDSLIPLQNYTGRNRSVSWRKGPTKRANLATSGRLAENNLHDHHPLSLPQRHREPRENGDFLRVCVMEMRMRRAGKLESAHGRARWWLPPRGHGPDDDDAAKIQQSRSSSAAPPQRWRGVSA